jgi:hypothetical protein
LNPDKLLKKGTDQTGTFFAMLHRLFLQFASGEKGCPVLSVPFFHKSHNLNPELP